LRDTFPQDSFEVKKRQKKKLKGKRKVKKRLKARFTWRNACEIAVATTWLRKDRGNKKWDSSVANAPSRMTRGKAE